MRRPLKPHTQDLQQATSTHASRRRAHTETAKTKNRLRMRRRGESYTRNNRGSQSLTAIAPVEQGSFFPQRAAQLVERHQSPEAPVLVGVRGQGENAGQKRIHSHGSFRLKRKAGARMRCTRFQRTSEVHVYHGHQRWTSTMERGFDVHITP